MTPILANGGGFSAGLGFVVLVALVVVGLSPVSAAVAWLKGKKKTAALLAMAGAGSGVAWLTNDFWWLLDRVLLAAVPVSLFGLVAALRAAKPGSWWFNRFYGEGKREMAIWGFSSTEGRKRRRRTAVVAGFSVVIGLVGGVFAINAIEDLLTTTWDEEHAQVSLYLLAPDFNDLAAIGARAAGDGIDVVIESRASDLGPQAPALVQGDLLNCVRWYATDAVHITISPREDAAVDRVLRRLGPLPGLVAVSSELGDVEGELGISRLEEVDGDEEWQCDAVEVLAYVDPQASDSDRRRLADAFRDRPDVLAVAEPIWRPEESSFREYPALVTCYGPREMRILVPVDTEEVLRSLVDELESSPIVQSVFSPLEWDEEPFAGQEASDCQDHQVNVPLAGDVGDSEAALVVAEARQIPGVAKVDYYPAPAELECEDCVQEASITIVRGDLELANVDVIGAAICRLSGVLGIVSMERESSPCEPLWIEARIPSSAKHQVDVVNEILGSHPAVDHVEVWEPYDEAQKRSTVVGSRNDELCAAEAEYLWRINAKLRRVDEPELAALARSLRSVEGVLLVGNAVGVVPEDPTTCGYAALSYWLEPDVSPTQRAEVFSVLDSFESVFAADIIEDRSHVGTDEDEVEVGWSGTVYLVTPDVGAAEAVRVTLQAVSGVAYAEVAYYEDEFLP